MNRRQSPSRRSFLRAMGVGPALLPLLQAERAFGACSGVSGPKRLFIIVWSNGMLGSTESWATTGNAFVLPPQMASLEPHRQDLILMDGLDYKFLMDMPGSGDRSATAAFPGLLTGAFYKLLSPATSSDLAGGLSIDQYVGAGLHGNGYPGRTSLNLAVQARSPAYLSWSAAGVPVLPDSDPSHVFSTLFGGPSTAPPIDKIAAMRKSVLDYVAGDLTRFAMTVGVRETITGSLAPCEFERALLTSPSRILNKKKVMGWSDFVLSKENF